MNNNEPLDLDYIADFLKEFASCFHNANREGAVKDIPEGSRYIRFSDTLAGKIETVLMGLYEHLTKDR